jgi:hypothetical protein
VKKQNCQVTENEAEMSYMTTDFYKHLYTSEGTVNMEEVLTHVPIKVRQEMNGKLIAPFSETKVKEALFQMFPTKAPGPDVFPAHFFQRHRELCGTKVTSVVLRILRGEDDVSGINNTMIVLIPKVASSEELGQYKLISLCNLLYNIASKVVANRLKLSLPKIISEEQSTFVPETSSLHMNASTL